MRLFTLITLVCLLSFATGCTTSGNDIAAPQIPESEQSNDNTDLDDFTSQCRANMRTITSQLYIYQASSPYNTYPETLEDVGMADYVCPECGLQYIYSTSINNTEFFLECPLQTDPNHGCIDNGRPSWIALQEPSYACRANMRIVASQSVLFFANHNRYPKTLEEIGMAGVGCPECNMEYMLTGDEECFRIECPLPTDPNHGCIDDGVPSWND